MRQTVVGDNNNKEKTKKGKLLCAKKHQKKKKKKMLYPNYNEGRKEATRTLMHGNTTASTIYSSII